jgi:hypothetical protein
MFDPKKLKVGDVFYSINESNQAFNRAKIQMELDGVDWFRYDKPLRTYELETYTVLGILRKELEGKWDDVFSEVTEYCVQYEVENQVTRHVIDFAEYLMAEERYFVDKGDALDYIKTMESREG